MFRKSSGKDTGTVFSSFAGGVVTSTIGRDFPSPWLGLSDTEAKVCLLGDNAAGDVYDRCRPWTTCLGFAELLSRGMLAPGYSENAGDLDGCGDVARRGRRNLESSS